MGSILEFPLEDCFKMKVILILALVAVTAAFGSDDNYILSDEFIAEINSKAKTWTAGRNFDVKTPRTRFLGMMGIHPKPGPTGTNLELFPVVCTEILKLANPTLRNH